MTDWEVVMGIIGWIILGLIAGAIAKAILPGTQGGGWLITLLLGVVGALLGGFLGSAIFGVGLEGFFDITTVALSRRNLSIALSNFAEISSGSVPGRMMSLPPPEIEMRSGLSSNAGAICSSKICCMSRPRIARFA